MAAEGRSRLEETEALEDGLAAGVHAVKKHAPGRVFRMHAICVPVEERRVRMIIVGARSFARLRLFDPLFNWVNRRIASEDQPVVESSWPIAVPPPSDEASVRTDRVTLRFRRYYFEQLLGSGVVERRRSQGMA